MHGLSKTNGKTDLNRRDCDAVKSIMDVVFPEGRMEKPT